MSNKASCTPDEWARLLRSPSFAAIATGATRAFGPIEVVRELFAADGMLALVSVSGKERTPLAATRRAAQLPVEATTG